MAVPDSEHQILEGSGRQIVPGAQLVGPSSPSEIIEVTVVLKPNVSGKNLSKLPTADALGALPLNKRKYFDRKTLEGLYKTSNADIALLSEFSTAFNLIWVGSCGAERLQKFIGSVADMERAFGTQLLRYKYFFGEYRGRVGELSVPIKFARVIQAVFGLDNRRQSKPFVDGSGAQQAAMADSLVAALIKRYDFPQNLNGAGETIGLIEFGGRFSPSDYHTYFQQQQVSPEPIVKFVGTANMFGVSPSDDEEVALDVEVAGEVAPGATFVVYFAPNTDKGWVDGLCAAVFDKENSPTILSVSWGETEDQWAPDTRLAVNQLLQQAAQLGMTICAASGDDGCAPDTKGFVRVTFPASSPYVLACGGTAFLDDTVEVVWNDGLQGASGGGESDVLARPDWQKIPPLPPEQPPVPRRAGSSDGRLLPDVAGLAARLYAVYIGGGYRNGRGGTSAAAPLWAGLIARLNQQLRSTNRVGYLNPLLYASISLQKTFSDVQGGDNAPSGGAGYKAGQGWDRCTGWGTPSGNKLLQALKH